MKLLVLSATSAALAAGTYSLSQAGFGTGPAILLGLEPLMVTWVLGWIGGRKPAGLLLLFSTVFYSAWYAYVYMDVFHWNPGLKNSLRILSVGVLSLPVMLPLWIVALCIRKAKSAQA